MAHSYYFNLEQVNQDYIDMLQDTLNKLGYRDNYGIEPDDEDIYSDYVMHNGNEFNSIVYPYQVFNAYAFNRFGSNIQSGLTEDFRQIELDFDEKNFSLDSMENTDRQVYIDIKGETQHLSEERDIYLTIAKSIRENLLDNGIELPELNSEQEISLFDFSNRKGLYQDSSNNVTNYITNVILKHCEQYQILTQETKEELIKRMEISIMRNHEGEMEFQLEINEGNQYTKHFVNSPHEMIDLIRDEITPLIQKLNNRPKNKI